MEDEGSAQQVNTYFINLSTNSWESRALSRPLRTPASFAQAPGLPSLTINVRAPLSPISQKMRPREARIGSVVHVPAVNRRNQPLSRGG
jgi:hypothetical protein